MRGWLKPYATNAMALAGTWPAVGATAGDAAAQNKQCIDMAPAHQGCSRVEECEALSEPGTCPDGGRQVIQVL